MPKGSPRVLAHRGASGYAAENTLDAFRRAVAMHADGVELDVHATGDGEIVVHHDPSVPGLGMIDQLQAADLRAHHLTGGNPIPTLAEALDVMGNHEVWVEVKALPPEHDQRLLALLRQGPAPSRYGVHSFDHRIVRRFAAMEFRTGILLAARLLDPVAPMQAAGATVLWQERSMIDADLVDAVHAAGGEVIAWTVNDVASTERLAALGVDAVCGNYPDRLRIA
jgi:glycerophosphoryl diester phosphodiesterase